MDSLYDDMLPRTRSAEERQLQEALEASLMSDVTMLARQASGGQGRDVLCKICYGNYAPAAMVVSCRNDHRWCRECLGGYLTSKVTEGQLTVLCPDIDEHTEAGCTEVMSEELIRDVLDADAFAKFDRFKGMQANPNMRECPREGCGHSQVGSPRRPAMVCERCSLAYCFVHASAHPGQGCTEYQKRQQHIEAETLWLMGQISKKCPKCKCPTQKNAGCNHMTCRECLQDWCWICGRKTGKGGGSHYSPINPLGCPFAQMMTNFIDSDRYHRTVLNFMLLGAVKIITAPFFLLAVPIALATLLLGIGLCAPCVTLAWLCCGCGDTCHPRERLCKAFIEMFDEDADLAIFLLGMWPLILPLMVASAVFGMAVHCALLPLHCCLLKIKSHCVDDDDAVAVFMMTAALPLGLCCAAATAAAFVSLSPLLLVYGLCSAPRPSSRPVSAPAGGSSTIVTEKSLEVPSPEREELLNSVDLADVALVESPVLGLRRQVSGGRSRRRSLQ